MTEERIRAIIFEELATPGSAVDWVRRASERIAAEIEAESKGLPDA